MVFSMLETKNKKLYFTVSINDDDFNEKTIPPRAYEIDSSNKEIKRFIFEEGSFKDAAYPFQSNKISQP